MAVIRFAFLAWAGAAFAQMDMNSSGIPDFTTPAAYSTYAASSITVTNPLTITDVASSSMPTIVNSSYDWATPANNSSSESITAVVGSSATTSSPVITVTNVIAVSSQTRTNSTMSTHAGGMGAGGRSTPKPSISATTTGKPFPDNAVVNGISIGLLVVSVALTALLQI
ncbi:hypothetical protein FHL15_001426 [Xylaria flabelliformis]|uniref:Mid2 domain-containing protein n=1 Tax=Xylaria flabelliformis TaxID=2512241 RepID=A0A553IBU1_9PEZI|nr:hypothetical protein FHL15_001426 [Xylaria flabelliformis]